MTPQQTQPPLASSLGDSKRLSERGHCTPGGEATFNAQDAMTYKTFLRSATNWEQFASALQETQEEGLSYNQARERCQEFNKNLTPLQIERGTKLEFTAE